MGKLLSLILQKFACAFVKWVMIHLLGDFLLRRRLEEKDNLERLYRSANCVSSNGISVILLNTSTVGLLPLTSESSGGSTRENCTFKVC
jgi:hypothetical protein